MKLLLTEYLTPFLKRQVRPSFRPLASWVLLLSLALTPLGAFSQAPDHFALKPKSRESRILNHLNERYERFSPTTLYNVHTRKFVGLDRIFDFDNTPLGNRIPVILVPGRAEEFQPNSWWKKFNRLVDHNKDFQREFKLYVYIYDSKLPLNVQAAHFNRDMKHFFGKLPKAQQSVLVTYSLGGMITTAALRDPEILDKVHTIFALAVPFHGSPMFDPSWFSTYLRPPNRSPIRKFWDRFLYRAYLFDKTNLIEGLRWDNFDGSLPQFDAVHLNVHGDLVFIGPSPCIEDAYTDALKEKTIIYASYMENGYTKSNQPLNPLRMPRYALEAGAQLPRELIGTVLPAYGLTVHSVFTYMNNQLANIPTFTPEHPEGKNTHLYRFNDGIIPLSSMLWLPKRPQPYDENINGLINAADVNKIRIFVNIDHMHIGDYDGFRPARIVTKDIVHPEEGKRKPNEWILHDILSLRPSFESLRQIYPLSLDPTAVVDERLLQQRKQHVP